MTMVLALKLTVAGLVFAVGLGSTRADLVYLWRRPGLLFRSLLAMYVLVPVAALALVRLLPFSRGVETALLVLAISAGAPLLPRKLMRLGREGYVFSLVVTSSVLAVAVVPAWLWILGPFFERETTVTPAAVGLGIARTFLVPLVLGMAIRWPLGEKADRISDGILGFLGLVLLLCAVVLLVVQWRLLARAGWEPFLILAGFTLVALAIGHGLGGPHPDDRTALAVCCATRHIGIAVLAAAAAPGPRVAALVLAYLLAAAVVSLPYIRWRRRALAEEP